MAKQQQKLKTKPKSAVTDGVSSTLRMTKQVQANPVMVSTRGPTNSIRIRNQEALNVSIAGGASSPFLGRNFFRLAASGTSVGTTWLPTIANQYSMYRIHRVTLRYVPTTGTTESGFVAMGFFPDAEEAAVNFAPSGASGTLNQLSQCRKFTQSPLYAASEIVLTKDDFVMDWYYVDPTTTSSSESRLTVAGAVGLLVQTNPNLTNSEPGILYLDYDVELKFPVTTNVNIV